MGLRAPWLVAAALALAAPAQGAADAHLDRALHQLAGQEYQASRNGLGLQAPNRAHGLRTWFDASGIRVHERSAPGSPSCSPSHSRV